MNRRIENDLVGRSHANFSRGIPRVMRVASSPPGKEEAMKNLIAVLALCLAASVPSFGAEHVITHSAKAVGKGTCKAAKYSAKETGRFLKFLF